jgi:RHS repeat-associated protein
MDYDEGNQRLWRRVTEHASGDIREEATIPGVAVYARASGGVWRLERLELVEGGYRPAGTGDALFAVTDAQGNVRGYANKDGLASAYAYYPYGTVQELRGDSAADRSRWQAKEWDEEYGKYYFGSRFFDPYFGLWISPDPAGQFANPYTYGGDPVNYVDPDGEWVHIVIGAAVGAVGGAIQCSMTDQSCARSILAGAAVGAGTAALAGPLAAAAGKAVTGAVGLATQSGTAAAVAGGAASGAVSGTISGYASSAANNAISRGGDWWRLDRSLGSDLQAGLWGGIGGGVIGGAMGGIQYGLSEAYQWKTHETVLEYAKKSEEHAVREKGVKYAAKALGMNHNRTFYYATLSNAVNIGREVEGAFIYKEISIGDINKPLELVHGDIVLGINAYSDVSNVFETLIHEQWHKNFFGIYESNIQEHYNIWKKIQEHKFHKYFSSEVKNKLEENIKRVPPALIESW